MKKSTPAWRLAVPLALVLTCGAAQAQLKAPAKSQPGAPLGSGIQVPMESAVTAPAAVPATPAPEDERPLDAVVQDIANCLLETLPKDWASARIEVTELSRGAKEREFEAKYFYVGADGRDRSFTPCDVREPALNVYKLNRALEPAKRQWKKATLLLTSGGKFDLKYDYDQADADQSAQTPAQKAAVKPAVKRVEKPGGTPAKPK